MSSLRELWIRGRSCLDGLPQTDPTLEARILLQKAAGLDAQGILADPDRTVPPAVERRFLAFIARRRARAPLAYLTGEREFWSLPFAVSPAVLIPRPETELLVEKAIALSEKSGGLIIEIGTGSGAIAVALAKELPRARIVAVDISRRALVMARRNAERHAVPVTFVHADLFRGLSRVVPEGGADMIVSNPPYVSEMEWRALEPEVRDHEPRRALVAGPTGLEFIRRLIRGARTFLKAGGRLLFEVGRGQDRTARSMFDLSWTDVAVFKDLRGIARVVTARRP